MSESEHSEHEPNLGLETVLKAELMNMCKTSNEEAFMTSWYNTRYKPAIVLALQLYQEMLGYFAFEVDGVKKEFNERKETTYFLEKVGEMMWPKYKYVAQREMADKLRLRAKFERKDTDEIFKELPAICDIKNQNAYYDFVNFVMTDMVIATCRLAKLKAMQAHVTTK